MSLTLWQLSATAMQALDSRRELAAIEKNLKYDFDRIFREDLGLFFACKVSDSIDEEREE